MYDVDVEQFWKDDEIAQQDNCFYRGRQVALGIRMSDECVFAELGIKGHPWAPMERARRLELNRRYNDKAEKMVGIRLLSEEFPPEDAQFPYVKRIGEVFGGRYVFHDNSEWLMESATDAHSLEALLDRVERLDMRAFMLPPNWKAEKRRIYEAYGIRPEPMRGIRGPVTLACSLMGSEAFLLMVLDEPELARRFSDCIAEAILRMAAVMDEESGETPDSFTGFGFADDNCCLMTPEMYDLFGYPILKRAFDVYSRNPGDGRFQHSDSAMGHLLPVLGRLNMTGVNFGPTVLIPEIRTHLKDARIDGCIAPFTFMRGDEAALTAEVTRDCADGMRYGGVNISTAGSINNGSSLQSLRLIMSVIQHYREA